MTRSNTSTAEGFGDGRGALSGLLVADFSRVLAGPYATQMLADFGADVVKVESPIGDETRQWRPPQRDGVSTYYLGINRNKRAMVLDFTDADDLRYAQRLAARADIVIENFKPGGLAKFGLDFESVHRANPRAVYASISGFGSAGGAGLPGYDLIAQGVSGLMSLTGDPAGSAYRSGVSVFDVMTGMNATIGILAALRHVALTGVGQHIEVNLLATALAAMANHSSTYIAAGSVPFRMGNSHPSLFPYEPLPASDGELIIVAASDRQFRQLAGALGVPELIDDERFRTVTDRNVNRELLRPLLVEALSTRTAEEWFSLLSAAGVPCGPINTIDGGIGLATQLGLEPVVQVGDGGRRVPVIRNPISLSETPPRYLLPPPGHGADDRELKDWLDREDD